MVPGMGGATAKDTDLRAWTRAYWGEQCAKLVLCILTEESYSGPGYSIACPCCSSVELITRDPAEMPGTAAVRDIPAAVVERSRCKFHSFTR